MIDNKRMRDLVSKLDEKHEISSEKEYIKESTEVIKNTSDRFKKLALYNESGNLAGTVGSQAIGGIGKTVNGAFENDNESAKYGYQAMSMPSSNVNLLPKEAFSIAIKRALDSGAPVNNISFYDEVNWHLSRLGFNAKLPLDIKNAIKELMEYGEVRS